MRRRRDPPHRPEARDLSSDLKLVSGLDGPFPLQPGRRDEARYGGGSDSREQKQIARPRDLYEPDRHIETIKIKARNFR
jgi:error-prone DNA polymerase